MWQHSMNTLAASALPQCSSVAPRTWHRQHSQSWNCAKREIRCQNASTAVDATADRSDSIPRSRPPRKAGSVHQDKVIIIGAGIAGLATAAACHKVGVPCVVFEREEELRDSGGAIGMWTNAFRALDALGVGDAIRRDNSLLTKIELCSAQGVVLRGFGLDECEGGPHEFRGVSRGGLLRVLKDLLPEGTVEYGVRIARASTDINGGLLELEDGTKLRGRVIVGADGGRSRVAADLGLAQPGYAGYSAYRGVAVFPENSAPIPADTCRQVWGSGVRAGMYPLNSREVYWFTVFNTSQNCPQMSQEDMQRNALSYVRDWKFGVAEAIQHTPLERITRSRITDRWPLPGQVLGKGALTLAGDAAHPMTPNLGQGGCTALEDAIVLARNLKKAIDESQPPSVAGQAPPPTLRSVQMEGLQEALRAYETERMMRCLPLLVRANLMGQALQLPLAPVTAFRDFFMGKAFSPAHFLSHATYDCGKL